MKIMIYLLSLIISTSTLAESCVYGISLCSSNQVCLKTTQNSAQCITHPDQLPVIAFPMKAPAGIFCDQGNLSPEGNSHTFTNTAYAIDLVSNRGSAPGIAIAASKGIVISYSECKTQNDQCGNGFGNYVQILRDDGHLLFYAHLEKVFVKTGDRVLVGQEIGIEGITGLTGENHRHLHFSVHYNWKDLGYKTLKENIGWLPNSVPFKINESDSRDLKCSRITGTIEWLKN